MHGEDCVEGEVPEYELEDPSKFMSSMTFKTERGVFPSLSSFSPPSLASVGSGILQIKTYQNIYLKVI